MSERKMPENCFHDSQIKCPKRDKSYMSGQCSMCEHFLPKPMTSITEQEKAIIDRIRELEYGTVEIVVKRGKPVFVNTKREEKLD